MRVLVDALGGSLDAGFLEQPDRPLARLLGLTGRCAWIVSTSWRPIVYSGLSEVSGSWNTAPMRRLRTWRICS